MSTTTYFWHDFAARQAGKAHEIAGSLGLGPEFDSDTAWKEIGRLREKDWRTLLAAWLERRAEFEQISHAFVREMQPLVNVRACMKAIATVAGLAAPLVEVCGLDDATLFARSLAKMVGQWGCETARGLLGDGPAGQKIANSQFSAQFANLIKQYNDDSHWRMLAKLTQGQWVQILESAAREKGVGPKTNKVIQSILMMFGAPVVGILSAIVVGAVALTLAAVMPYVAAAIVLIAAVIVVVIIGIAAVGCMVAGLLLYLGILDAKDAPELTGAQEQILELVRNGYLAPYPSATQA